MEIHLRTVIYSNKVEIGNVPVYCCKSCQHAEVLPGVKQEIVQLISSLGHSPEKQKLMFDECNEWANMLTQAADPERSQQSIQGIVGNRIDELLDMLLVAKSLNDEEWIEELTGRLQQLTQEIPVL